MKKNYLLTLLVWYACLVSRLPVGAQPSDKQLLEDYLQKMRFSGQEKEFCYFHVVITPVPRPGSRQAKASFSGEPTEVKVIAGPHRLYYESTHLSIYRDEKDIFTVIHPQKRILHAASQSASATADTGPAESFLALQKHFLSDCVLKSSRDTLVEAKPWKVFRLVPHAKYQAQFPIREVVYYFNLSQKRIEKQVVYYHPSHGLLQQTIEYREFSFPFRGKVPRSARSYLLTDRNQLKRTYQQYRLEEGV